MDLLNGIVSTLPAHPGLLIGVATGIMVVGRLCAHLARWIREDMPTLIDDDVAERFEIGTRESDLETELAAEIADDLGKLIEADRWDLVHSLIRAWERDAAATPFGTMFHRLGIDRALAPFDEIAAAAEETGTVPDAEQIDALVAAFDARAAANPDDHIAAVLTARAHIAAGRIARGDGRVNQVSAHHRERMSPHFDAAERILARFALEGSSAVAEARYLVCLGLENADDLIRRRYGEWIAVNADDIAPFQTHGVYLLPRWFGDLDELETEARRAAEISRQRRGAAGYVIFHGAVMMSSHEALPGIDPDLFVRAALDRARTAGGQWGVNRMAEFLMRAMLDSSAEARDTYRDGLTRLVEEHLRVLIPAAWSSPMDDIRHELARLFKDELENGSRVRVSARGFEVLPLGAEAAAPA